MFKKIFKIQNEYKILIKQYETQMLKEELTFNEISHFIDEVKIFWLKRFTDMEYLVEEIARENTAFLLTGAIYLNIEDNEHYYIKTLGDVSFLSDPILKMENFFKLAEDKINLEKTIDYFKKVYRDLLKILNQYLEHFIIIPSKMLAIDDDKEHFKLIEDFFMRFVSSAFDIESISRDEFCSKYCNYEEIENDINKSLLRKLIFNDYEDTELSLRERVEKSCAEQMNMKELTKSEGEASVFLILLFCWISQILDTLITCIKLGVYPYIRFEITFNYLIIFMNSFEDDEKLKSIVEKTIIFYILRITIPSESFKSIEFDNYVKKMVGNNFLDKIEHFVDDNEINIGKDGTREIREFIIAEYNRVLMK